MGRAPSADCTVFDDRADSAEGRASTANGTNGTRVERSETKGDWSLAWDSLNGPEHEMVESFRLSRSGDRLGTPRHRALREFSLRPPTTLDATATLGGSADCEFSQQAMVSPETSWDGQ